MYQGVWVKVADNKQEGIMSKKTETVEGTRPQAAPASIKVSTLIKAIVIVTALAGAYIAGTMIERVESQHNTQNVINAASSIFKEQSKE